MRLTLFAVDEVPIIADLVRSGTGHVERQGVRLGPVTNGLAVSGLQVQAQKEAVGHRELCAGSGPSADIENRIRLVVLPELGIGHRRSPDHQPQLVERQSVADADGERERHHLEIEGTLVAGGNFVEAIAVVGDDPGKDVKASGRALRVGFASNVGWQAQGLDERDEVGTVGVENGPFLAEIDFVDDEVFYLSIDGIGIGQEAAADPPGEVTETEVDAGRLDVLGRYPVLAGVDMALLDGLGEQLIRENTGS